MVTFARSPFKLFTLRFSNKSVQRGLELISKPCLLSFEINNCFQTSLCSVVNSNIAIGSLPTLQISLGIVALYEKIYYSEPILTVVSNIGEDV